MDFSCTRSCPYTLRMCFAWKFSRETKDGLPPPAASFRANFRTPVSISSGWNIALTTIHAAAHRFDWTSSNMSSA